MSVVVLNSVYWDAQFFRIATAQVIRMKVASNNFRFYFKNMSVVLYRLNEKIQGFQIVKITNMLADECKIIPSEAEC